MARVDSEGSARAGVERVYFEWLLASLADAVRQVMLSPVDEGNDWKAAHARRRETVLELLDTIEEVQADALALLERDQPPYDRGAAGVGRSPLT